MKREDFKDTLKFNSTDILEQKEQLEDYFSNLNDIYVKANSFEVKEYYSYLSAAIYLTFRKMYPDLSIYIPIRIKSDNSTIKNYSKEFQKDVLTKYDSEKNEIDLSGISKDFVAATIVLDHINTSRESKVKYSSKKIDEYTKLRDEILSFVNETNSLMENNMIDEKTYIKLKERTLELILRSTYPDKCINERTISYDTELKEVQKSYSIKDETNSFLPSITEDQISNLKSLLLELRSRSSDKLQQETLKETIPNIFNSPLIKNALKADVELEKDVKKPNGFVALYYKIHTPFGVLELQAQSNKRYYIAKKGSAFHSGMGKEIDITSFFELVNPNDEHPLSFYLSKLDNIPANELLSDVEIPEFKTEEDKYKFLNSPDGKNYNLTLETNEYMSHIKIKDEYTYTPNTSIKTQIYNPITKKNEIFEIPAESSDSQVQTPVTMDTNTFILELAKSISPFMGVCSSGHTSFSTASVNPKNLVGEFTEILRKKDTTSCLANILVQRLRDILKNTHDQDYEDNLKIKDALPRDIAKEDIVQYASELQEKLKEQNTNLHSESQSIEEDYR